MSAMTEMSSRPLFTLEDVFLKYCMLNFMPPNRKEQPSTSSKLDRTEPSSDTCMCATNAT